MNCANHPSEVAVSQCVDCGKGLCVECTSLYKPVLCSSCYQSRKSSEIKRHIWRLIVYAVLFLIGYKLNFLSFGNLPEDMRVATGYLMVSGFAGYVFVNYIMPWKMIAGTTGQWNFYYLFKFILYVGTGFFVAPFAVLWTLIKLIRAIRM